MKKQIFKTIKKLQQSPNPFLGTVMDNREAYALEFEKKQKSFSNKKF